MAEKTPNTESMLDLTQPLPPQAEEFTRTMQGMLDGKEKDEATVAEAFDGLDGVFDLIAATLYNMASMLVGAGEESEEVVVAAVSDAEVTCCGTVEEARKSGRRALAREALQRIAARDADSLAAPESLEHAQTCIENEDLDAAGESGEELERVLAGPDRDRVRVWLESLPTAMRVIYVLRAVGGISSPETAALLAAYGGPKAAGWTADAVRELFQQGLCSLASQLLHEGIKN
jgi:DNA-directed RNA polymerase specialized sigma24 family protein